MKRLSFCTCWNGLIIALALMHAGATRVTAQGYGPMETWAEERDEVPFSLVGKLNFDSGGVGYFGSASLVTPRSVLTAGHNIYDSYYGVSTSMRFYLKQHNSSYVSQRSAVGMVFMPRFHSAPEGLPSYFKRDLGKVFFATAPDPLGQFIGFRARPKQLRTYKRMKIVTGYPGVTFSGSQMCYSLTYWRYRRVSGAYHKNLYISSQGGMSGGPVWMRIGGIPRVYGVHVSSGGGMRALVRKNRRLVRLDTLD